MSDTTGVVQQFVERTGQLYSLPAVAAEVLRLTSEPRIDPRALKDCLERDPALATRLLRVVNSSLFGLTRQVSDLGQALTLLGIRPLKMLVLGFSLPRELLAGLEANVLANYWRRTLTKAVAARELAERLWRMPGDEAFMAGLVQDIGVLCLIQQLGPSYQQFLQHVHEHGGCLLERELESLGFDHLVLSARLLRHWDLPENLCAAVGIAPHEAQIAALDATERTLPQVLHLADLIADLFEQPFGAALRNLLACGGKYCGLTFESLQPIVKVLQGKVEELATVLSLELPTGESYTDLLVSAHQRLAEETISGTSLAPPQEDELLVLARQLQAELATATSGAVRPLTVEAPRAWQPAAAIRPAATKQPLASSDASGRGPQRRAERINDSRLSAQLAAGIQRARQSRRPLTLALFAVERFSELVIESGAPGLADCVQALGSMLAEWTGQRSPALHVQEDCYALLWDDCPRNEAVALARTALDEVKSWWRQRGTSHGALALSAGLATLELAAKNYPANELIEAAERSLGAAQLSGGDTVKSIVV